MRKLTNKHQLPPQIEAYAKRRAYSKGEANFSATELLRSPYERVMTNKFEEHLEEDLMDRVWSLFGSAVHEMLDRKAGKDVLPEERLFHTYAGKVVSGQIDVQKTNDDGTVSLEDWKVTGAFAYKSNKSGDSTSHVEQLNIYADLMRKAKGIEITGIRVYYILKDWKEIYAASSEDYPQAPISYIDYPVWPKDKIEAFILDRVALHRKAEAQIEMGVLPAICTDKERWKKDDEWAVMKGPDEGRALRVFKQYEKAKDYLDKARQKHADAMIQIREGEYTKCLKYCDVREFCPYGGEPNEGIPPEEDNWDIA